VLLLSPRQHLINPGPRGPALKCDQRPVIDRLIPRERQRQIEPARPQQRKQRVQAQATTPVSHRPTCTFPFPLSSPSFAWLSPARIRACLISEALIAASDLIEGGGYQSRQRIRLQIHMCRCSRIVWYVVVVLVTLLTGRQVADMLGVSNETVLRWALEGELPSIRDDVLPRREPAGPAAPSADVTFEDYCERFLERQTTAPRTVATLRDRLRSARQTFGRWTLAQLEYAAADIAAWRAGRCPKAQGSGTPRRCGNASPQPSAGATWIATPPSTPAPTPSRAPGKSTRSTPTSSRQSTRSSTSPTASSSPPPEKPGCAPRNGVRCAALTSIVPAAGSPSSGSSPRAG
jgi:hypothetical protein